VTIHVEKVGQRKILVGTGGTVIKSLRLGAENRLKQLLGRKVRLELFVRVTPRWKETPRMLAELGYERVPGEKS
jgi:GTP-binding protein Era